MWAMTNPAGIPSLETEIETRILALRSIRPRVMFSELADAFPDCTWQILFNALSRLSKQKHVTLVAHRWDYEVIFLDTATLPHGMSGSSRTLGRCEYCEYDKRAEA